MERVIEDVALLPVVAAVGAEVALHQTDVFLLIAQARHLPRAQPAAPGAMANASPLPGLAAIHAALELPVTGALLRMLLDTLAGASIPRVRRRGDAEYQSGRYGNGLR
jgi:hypothetical protein